MNHNKHFQEIKDSYYKQLVSNLFIHFPELHNEADLEMGPYYNISRFHDFFMENVNDILIYNRSIIFINESLKLGKHETEDVFVIELFTPIYEDIILVDKCLNDLEEKALKTFNKYKSLKP